jgi:transposase
MVTLNEILPPLQLRCWTFMRVAPLIELSAEQRTTLEAWANGRKTQVRIAARARVVLLAAEGKQNLEIATILSISMQKAARWRLRFLAKGLPGLEKDAPRPGRLPSIAADKVAEVIRLTTLEKPAHATHWSTRRMAKQMGISDTSVLRIWRDPRTQAPSLRVLQSQQ